jgi:hypothetical protein
MNRRRCGLGVGAEIAGTARAHFRDHVVSDDPIVVRKLIAAERRLIVDSFRQGRRAGARVRGAAWNRRSILAVLDGERGGMDANGPAPPFHVRDAEWCREANGKLSCKRYMARYRPELKHFAISPGGTLQLQGDAVPSK